MIQYLLSFDEKNCKIFADCVVSQPDTTLSLWSTDPIASRILEALIDSESVDKKVKKKLVLLFKGQFARLAADKYASHFVDKCFLNSKIEIKELVCTELLEKMATLLNNFHAKFILRNCGVDLFKRRKDQWLLHHKKAQEAKPKSKKNVDEIDLVFSKKK
jgi:nucleolar protein 9